MSVSTVEAGVIRIGDGVTTVFSFSFEGRIASEIKVSNIVGQALEPVLSGFTPALDLDGVGGTVTFSVAPASLQSFYIYRDTELTQLVSVSSQSKYDPKIVEDVWDKLTFITQDLAADVALSVKVAPGSSSDTLLAAIFAAEASTAADAIDTAADVVAAEAAAAAAAASAITSGGLTADLDPIALPAGFTRYNGTTAGTFPAGISAANEGVLEVRRVDASNAVEMLSPRLLDRTLWRRVAAGVKQAWQEFVSVPLAGAVIGDMAYWTGTAWARLATVADGRVIRAIGGVPTFSAPWVALSTTTAAAKGSSGTPLDITGVPAWATEVELILDTLVFSTVAAGTPPSVTCLNSGGPPGSNIFSFGLWDNTLGGVSGVAAYLALGADLTAVNYSGGNLSGIIKFTKVDSGDNWQVQYQLMNSSAIGFIAASAVGKFSIISGGALTGFRILHGHVAGSTYASGSVIARYR